MRSTISLICRHNTKAENKTQKPGRHSDWRSIADTAISEPTTKNSLFGRLMTFFTANTICRFFKKPRPFSSLPVKHSGVALAEYTLILVTCIVVVMAAVNSGTTKNVMKRFFGNTVNPSAGGSLGVIRSFGNI